MEPSDKTRGIARTASAEMASRRDHRPALRLAVLRTMGSAHCRGAPVSNASEDGPCRGSNPPCACGWFDQRLHLKRQADRVGGPACRAETHVQRDDPRRCQSGTRREGHFTFGLRLGLESRGRCDASTSYGSSGRASLSGTANGSQATQWRPFLRRCSRRW